MDIKLISQSIPIDQVARMAKQQFGELIKATVDVRKKSLALGGDLHADEEQLLLENGSAQKDLWGVNLYPAKFGTPDFVEFDSMINIRPSQGNKSRGVEDDGVRQQIREVIDQLIIKEDV